MKIPKSLTIGPFDFSVTRTNDLQTGDRGHFSSRTMNLAVANNMEESAEAEVFLHEIMEAIVWMSEIEITHKDLTQIATGILSAIRQNNLDFRKQDGR